MNKQYIIYGAMSVALGIKRACNRLYLESEILGFIVSKKEGNPDHLDGLPVMAIEEFAAAHHNQDTVTVIVAAPEPAHAQMIEMLHTYRLRNYIAVDWRKEEEIMSRLYEEEHIFPSVHKLSMGNQERDIKIRVYAAKSAKDIKINLPYQKPKWMYWLQAGSAAGRMQTADYYDNEGDNISAKNEDYCELTALYWIWKNGIFDSEYCGLFQYRRFLNITDDDWERIAWNDVDVILPLPTVHAPDITEHHQRYIRESDWKNMLTALEEMSPGYAEVFPKILKQEYLYNYNIMVAKPKVFRAYCAWLFPILKRTEELCALKGDGKSSRYIGYLGESLASLYFLYNADKLKIYHAGRIMRV